MAKWNNTEIPLAYFFTFRARGTWLHGDKRGSVSRHRNTYGTRYLPAEAYWHRTNKARLNVQPVRLNSGRRRAAVDAIRETCEKRGWELFAVNARSNHVHCVADIGSKNPEIALNAFKANGTRIMRERRIWLEDGSPWADKGSKSRLWTDNDLDGAIAYVRYEQGEPLPDDED